ncbi:MAG: tetratricopeptide repeat protein, partial [Cyanobacteria bacterium P01_F01_bin.42]
LSVYRFQEQARLPKAALLALLWDVNASRQSQVIQSVRNRSLVEFHCGKYWLHPVIRAEAIARLKQAQDWEATVRKAAAYWTQSVSEIQTIDEALKAWEAFYHYVEIHDFKAASQVILQSRLNQWQQYLPLGSLMYRMGLAQLVLSAVNQIVDRVRSQPKLSELQNILGDLYWITGNVPKAIACQDRSFTIASDWLAQLTATPEECDQYPHQAYYFRMLEIDSLFSLGLYHIDLWDLPKASSLLQRVIELSQKTKHERWAEKASVCLALVKSSLGDTDALSLAQPIYEKTITTERPAFAYFIQRLGQTYTNLGQLQEAQRLFEMAIAFAQQSQYQQVIAVSNSGLAEIARFQDRYDSALALHQKAVDLLEDIGAACDLADAYLQWGLTLKHLDESPAECFDQAIALFSKIGAPLQIERVRAIALG